ncbi:MAG: ABC transporter ATP-binding protein [Chloroflexota bacterium]
MGRTRRVFRLVFLQWPPLAIALASGTGYIILQLVPPLFIRDAMSIIGGKQGQVVHSISAAIVWLLIANAFRSVLFLVSNQMGHIAGYRVVRNLRLEVYGHLQRLSPSFYTKEKTGFLVSKVVNDVDTMELFVAHALLQMFTSLILLLGTAVIMFIINWRLAIVSLAPIPPLVIVAFSFGKKMQHNYRSLRSSLADLAAQLTDSLSGMVVIQAFTREDAELRKLGTRADSLYRHFIQASWLFHASSPLIEFLGGLGTILVLWVGSGALGGASISDLVAFFLYTRFFYVPISQIGQINDQVQNALAGAERIFDVLDAKPEIGESGDATAPVLPSWSVEFRAVDFGYSNEPDVLHQVSFRVGEGEMLAIVGPSGAGKTTITKLLDRFYDVQRGAVLIAGRDVRTLPLQFLRQHVGLVLQDVFLFDGSVLDNLLIGRPEATTAQVVAAATAANAHEFIVDLPDRYDTLVGERGVRLSGGQKQRLSIARAILKDAPILVLDEATSSVATASEALIQETLSRLATAPLGSETGDYRTTSPRRRTTIVVAHRLSTIKHADRILVMERGSIVEEGTHEALMQRGGLYSELYRAQLRRQEWELV